MVFELLKGLIMWTLIIGFIVYISRGLSDFFLSLGFTNIQIYSSFVMVIPIVVSYFILIKKN